MGIQGLIPFLEKASQPVNISQFSGTTVAIDAYCWLHKGAFACAEKLARGDHTDQYVVYCMKYVNMLLHHNIKPILVFDGSHLKAKADTEKKRRESRELNRRKAAELLRLDRANEAKTFLRRCVDVTHEMALNLIQECRSRNVDCIVAPFEADAQLAFFSLNDIVEIVITEDSDLLLFGCKKVLFKMDTNGNGLLIDSKKLHIAMGIREDVFSLEKFRYMCILSGCDYLPSLPGIGLAKACRFITRSIDPDIHKALTRLPMHLNMSQLCVSQEYRDKFIEADSVFKYQPVFNPFLRKVVPLNTPPEGESVPNLWVSLPEDQAEQLAMGNLNPFSLKQMDDWSPNSKEKQLRRSTNWNGRASHKSIWSSDFLKVTKETKEINENKHKNAGAFVIERPSTLGKRVIEKAQIPTNKRSIEDIEDEKRLYKEMYGSTEQPAKKLCLEQSYETEEIEEDLSPVEKSKQPARLLLSKSKASDSAASEEKRCSKLTNKLRKTVIDDTQNVVSGYFFDSFEPDTNQNSIKIESSFDSLGEATEEFSDHNNTSEAADEDVFNTFIRKPLVDIKNTSPPVSPVKLNASNVTQPTSPELIPSKRTKPFNPFSKKLRLKKDETKSDENESLLDSIDKITKDTNVVSRPDSLLRNLTDFDAEAPKKLLNCVEKSPNGPTEQSHKNSDAGSPKKQSHRNSNTGTGGNFSWAHKLNGFKNPSTLTFKKSLVSNQEFKSPVQSFSTSSSPETLSEKRCYGASILEEASDASSSEKNQNPEVIVNSSPVEDSSTALLISSQESDEGFCSPSLNIKSEKGISTPEQAFPNKQSSAKKTLSQSSCRRPGLSKKSPSLDSKQSKLTNFYFKEKPKIS